MSQFCGLTRYKVLKAPSLNGSPKTSNIWLPTRSLQGLESVIKAIAQWLHLSEFGSDQWVLPIYTAWNKAVAENRVAVQPDAVNEAGLHITTRLDLVRHIVLRLRRDLSALVKEVDKHVTKERQYTPDCDGIALPVHDHMKYLMIADLHSIISKVDA